MLKDNDLIKFMNIIGNYRETKPISEFTNSELIAYLKEQIPEYMDIWIELERRLILNGSDTNNIEEAEIIEDFEDNMGAMG